MELPEDVLRLVHDYARPSKAYQMYVLVFKILVHGMPLDMREGLTRMLKRSVRLHYDQFLPLFLELEKSHVELNLSQIEFCSKDTPGEVRNEYYFKLRYFASKRREVMSELNKL